MPHGLRLPAVRHMDCRIPQTCIARREPHYSSTATPSAQRSASNTEAYRQKSTPYPTPQPKNSKQPRHNVSHPTPKHTDKSQHRITHHNPRTPKKKPEGCASWLLSVLCYSHKSGYACRSARRINSAEPPVPHWILSVIHGSPHEFLFNQGSARG